MLRNGFKALNFVQFLDALNENLFKLLVVFFLIHIEGTQFTAKITTIIGGLFILPFILFSSLGGIFGDHWSKTSVIRATRLMQVATTVIALVFVSFGLVIPTYIIFILMATLAALFGPSKYGMIGELVRPRDMMQANSWIAVFTLFGVILGTTLASVIDSVFDKQFPWMFSICIFLASLGAYYSFKIPFITAANPNKKQELFIYRELYQTFIDMKKTPFLILSLLVYSFFYFYGAFLQINIIPFSVEILGMDPNIGGYLFGFSAIGMGIGSWIASKTERGLKLLAPCAAGGGVFCFFLSWHPFAYWLNGLWLLIIGICAGIFLVPSQAFIVEKSAPEDRARNFATANFLSFLFALLAAFCLYIFSQGFGWNAGQNFAALGWLTLGVAFLIHRKTRKSGSAASNNE